MLVRLLRWTLLLACTLGVQAASADIYTWTDASGIVNVSNVAPPDGIKVTKVMQESPPRPAPVFDPVADASRQAEMQALAARVRQLEYEAEISRRQMPSPVDYAAMAPPMPFEPMQYVADAPQQPTGYGCDPTWAQCGNWWGAPFYPVVVVVRSPGFRRPPPFHGGHRVGMQAAVRAPGGFNRR